MSQFENLVRSIEEAPSQAAALDALIEGLAQRIKATSNDQNVQKLSRELRIAAPGLVAAVASHQADAGVTVAPTQAEPTKGVKGICRCEARIAPAILDGYACGNPECWRTAEVQASFEMFVGKLAAKRGDAPATQRSAPPAD